MIHTIILARHGEYPVITSEFEFGPDAIIELSPAAQRLLHLNTRGREQAVSLGSVLAEHAADINICLAAPCASAIETGSLAYPHKRWRVDKQLRKQTIGGSGTGSKLPGAPRGVRIIQLDSALAEARRKYPLDWQGAGGESIRTAGKRLESTLQKLLASPHNGTALLITHGEIVIAGRALPMLGAMSDKVITSQFAPNWPSLSVCHCQFDEYTRADPRTGEVSDTFDWMRSVRVDTFSSTGWIKISRS